MEKDKISYKIVSDKKLLWQKPEVFDIQSSFDVTLVDCAPNGSGATNRCDSGNGAGACEPNGSSPTGPTD